jgi:hypothetical protein
MTGKNLTNGGVEHLLFVPLPVDPRIPMTPLLQVFVRILHSEPKVAGYIPLTALGVQNNKRCHIRIGGTAERFEEGPPTARLVDCRIGKFYQSGAREHG